MLSGMTVADVSDPGVVHGVHGTSGESWWKCLARRPGLTGPWEAVEWASLPPGGVSGEHLHTRTEEIYFILRGSGEILLNGRSRPASAGDVILTRLGDRHGLVNSADGPLDWLVVELTAALPFRAATSDG
jgi:mannose-6-phosphate isomerase-like protein (cupin superfamily)